tara:strand:- start:46 stop:1461 length:1416 start_codon:yes stop_codon:yes gene_type:complete
MLCPEIDNSLDKCSVYNYFYHNSDAIPPNTFYENVKTLIPGGFLKLNFINKDIEKKTYWDIDEQRPYLDESSLKVKKYIVNKLTDSLNMQLGDNNTAFALSGGLDSSSLICLTKKAKKKFPYKIFSVVVDDKEFDDSGFQAQVAQMLSINPIVVKLNELEMTANLKDVLNAHDSPITPTTFGRWLLYKTVNSYNINHIIEGWGNDQLLGGYDVHTRVYLEYLIQKGNILKLFEELNKIKARADRSGKPSGINIFQIIRGAIANHNILIKYKKRLKKILSQRRQGTLYNLMPIDECSDIYGNQISERLLNKKFKNYFDRFMYTSLLITGLPFGLRVIDTNSMYHSINIKLPFLDHNFVEYCFRIPPSFKINQGYGKFIMREAVNGIVPDMVRYRDSKRGLEIPEAQWFNGSFKKIVLTLPDANSNYFDQEELAKLVDSFNQGQKHFTHLIWRSFNIIFIENRLRGINILNGF